MAASGITSKVAVVQPKSEQAKKGELVKEIHQLKIKLQNAEREKASQIYNKHGDFFKEFTLLQELENKLSTETKTEQTKLQQQLAKIKNMVKKFQRELQNVKPSPEFLEKLKGIMEEIECHVSEFKEQQKNGYEQLVKEERVTTLEVTSLEKRFEAWKQLRLDSDGLGKIPRVTPSLPSHRDTSRDLPSEVKNLERFLTQSGGPRGGWDEYDHGTFLKYRNRHRGKPSFLRELCAGALPTKTESEIRQHEEWYRELMDLTEKKKEAIQKWKERKEAEKEEMQIEAQVNDTEEAAENERQEMKQQQSEKEKYERRTQLNRWKVEKELQKAEDEERKLRAHIEQAKQAEREKQKQFEVKRLADEYKQLKQKQEEDTLKERALQQRLDERKRREATQGVEKFRNRDLATVKQKQRERDLAKRTEEKEKEERIAKLKSQVKVCVDRDPSRLLQPTQGWRERLKEPATTGGGPIVHMPHRAVPTWRQGLS